MKRNKKEETIPNLNQWLHEEASLRSRGKLDLESSFEERSQQRGSFNMRTDNHTGDFHVSKDGRCPLGCQAKHPLAACPHYETSTVDQRWEIVKQNQRCRKCLRSHHTKDCKKSDGTTCDKCKRTIINLCTMKERIKRNHLSTPMPFQHKLIMIIPSITTLI